VITKVMYAAVAATLLAPVPALAADLQPPEYSPPPAADLGPPEYFPPAYSEYAPPVVQQKRIIHERIVEEEPLSSTGGQSLWNGR